MLSGRGIIGNLRIHVGAAIRIRGAGPDPDGLGVHVHLEFLVRGESLEGYLDRPAGLETLLVARGGDGWLGRLVRVDSDAAAHRLPVRVLAGRHHVLLARCFVDVFEGAVVLQRHGHFLLNVRRLARFVLRGLGLGRSLLDGLRLRHLIGEEAQDGPGRVATAPSSEPHRGCAVRLGADGV